MTSVILDAICFNRNIEIVAMLGITNKRFANSLAPRLLESKIFTRRVPCSPIYFKIVHDYKVMTFSTILSKTFVYTKELNFKYINDNPRIFLEHIKEDIPHMRLLKLISIGFIDYLNFNIGCLRKLSITDYTETYWSRRDDGITDKRVVIKSLYSLDLCLTNISKPQDFLLSGYFENIDFYIHGSSYLRNMNKILGDVAFCNNLEIMVENSEELPENTDFSCVFGSLRIDIDGSVHKYISTAIFNEKLKDLIICCDAGTLLPIINYSNTILNLIGGKDFDICVVISKTYENKHVKIKVSGNNGLLQISNAEDKIFEINFMGANNKVEFDKPPEKYTIIE